MSASWAGSITEDDLDNDNEKKYEKNKIYTIHHPPKYDTLDIMVSESNAFSGMRFSKRDQFMNWVNFFLTGVFVGIVAFGID